MKQLSEVHPQMFKGKGDERTKRAGELNKDLAKAECH